MLVETESASLYFCLPASIHSEVQVCSSSSALCSMMSEGSPPQEKTNTLFAVHSTQAGLRIVCFSLFCLQLFDLCVPADQSTSSTPPQPGARQPSPSPGPRSPAHRCPEDRSHRPRTQLLRRWSPWSPVFTDKGQTGGEIQSFTSISN